MLRSRPIVLVVLADRDTQLVLRRAIELEGCTVVWASSVSDAYGVLAEHVDSVALLVLDITKNLAAAAALRQLQLDAARVAHIPAVVVTDRSLTTDECAVLRPTGVLMKPLRPGGALVPVQGDHPCGITVPTPTSAPRRRVPPYRVH